MGAKEPAFQALQTNFTGKLTKYQADTAVQRACTVAYEKWKELVAKAKAEGKDEPKGSKIQTR